MSYERTSKEGRRFLEGKLNRHHLYLQAVHEKRKLNIVNETVKHDGLV